GKDAIISFSGDCILLVYLLATARFFTIIAAMDTGSSFEGMGSSREGSFAIFAEPTFFLCLATLMSEGKSFSLSGIYSNLFSHIWMELDPTFILIGFALFILALVENCRIPFDDPNTHLELTMIHEVMVLDHSAVDLGCILYGSSIKLWIFGSLLIGLFLPHFPQLILKQEIYFFVGMGLFAILIGIIESTMARIRLLKVFDLLLAGLAISIFAFILQMVR
ncbi:MAG: NADH-quinone oxidoreductase subunit H, partial [Chlamydiota bacterium]